MEVTDLKYSLENRLIPRMEAFARMVTREKQIKDVFFCIHGRTGTGKTNTALVLSYFLKCLTGREIRLFFRTETAAEFIKKTNNKIIIIDEPALDSLSKDQMTTRSKDFTRIQTTMRQKRHIIIMCITRFWRFPPDLVIDRSLAMINMYDKEGKDIGRFHYIRQKHLDRLWEEKVNRKRLLFGKLKAFGGRMPERMEKLDENGIPYFNRMGIWINNKPNCTYDDYKRMRDEEVESIGGEFSNKSKKEKEVSEKLELLRYYVTQLIKKFDLNREDCAAILQTNQRRFQEWERSSLRRQFSLEKSSFEGLKALPTFNILASSQNNQLIKPTGAETYPITPQENEKELIDETNKKNKLTAN